MSFKEIKIKYSGWEGDSPAKDYFYGKPIKDGKLFDLKLNDGTIISKIKSRIIEKTIDDGTFSTYTNKECWFDVNFHGNVFSIRGTQVKVKPSGCAKSGS